MYNKIVENLLLPVGDVFLRTNFIATLNHLRRVQWEDLETLQHRQRTSLADLLTHATTNTQYYKHLGVLSENDPTQWLKKFPLLTKRNLKENGERLIGKGIFKEKLVKESSSGSSGIQSSVYLTKREVSQAQAAQTLLWEWSGYTLGSPLLQLGMTTRRPLVKRLKDYFLRVNYQQAFNISQPEAEKAIARITGNNYFFGGYASGLYGYALLAEQLSVKPSFRSVISWGDKMFPHYRSKIEKVFNTRVFDVYGTTEGFVIAGQCSAGSYHVVTPHVFLELLDKDGKEVKAGEVGFVVATRLDAYAMPLIRYYLGDIAVREKESFQCPCGRHLPVLRQIIGRDTDLVRTRSGKLLIVHFFTGIFEHFPQVRQFRVIQRELERIIVEYIPEVDCSDAVLNTLRETIHEKLGERMTIDFVEVAYIPDTPSGKPQIIKSELPVSL